MKKLSIALLTTLALSSPSFAQNATAVGVGVSNSRSASRSAALSQAASNSAAGVSRSGNASITTNTNVQGVAPSVFAPGMSAAGIESCNGSVSLGGAAVGGGGALGFPWQDGPCNKRLNARTLFAFGLRAAALQELCLDDDLAVALISSGHQCNIGRYAAYSVAYNAAEPSRGRITDKRGRVYDEVPCGTRGARRTAEPGVCARLASN